MIIKTVARRNWPEGDDKRYTTWYEPLRPAAAHHGRGLLGARRTPRRPASRRRVTSRLLGMVVHAEANRISREEAEEVLSDAPAYSSPFIEMPVLSAICGLSDTDTPSGRCVGVHN